MSTFYANPYDFDAKGFYFTEDTGKEMFAVHMKAAGVEEVEIEFIDGEDWEAALFEAAKPNQATIMDYLEAVEEFIENDTDAATAYHRIAYNGEQWEDVICKDLHDFGTVFQGSVMEYAEDYMDATGFLDNVPEIVSRYFDWESYARDLEIGGDVVAFDFAGKAWVYAR